jgi:hypothetical protein
MADIDVVKKGSHTWLWIIIILVILLAVFFLFARNPETRTGLLNEKGGQPFAAAPPHVEAAVARSRAAASFRLPSTDSVRRSRRTPLR